MDNAAREYPCLRPVEAVRHPEGDRVILRDPTQLANGMLVVDEVQLTLLALLDGSRRQTEIQSEFARRFGQLLLSEELNGLLDQLDSAGFLAGDGFDAYYGGLAEQFRRAPYRALRDP